MHSLACRQDLIRHHKISPPRIIAVLQRGADKLDLILVPGDLCQETPAGAHNRHRDNRKLLYGGVRQRGNPFDRFGSIAFLIKSQKVIHRMDLMAPLGEPGRKHHVFLRFLYRSAVQNFCFNLVDVPIPPLSQLLVRTDGVGYKFEV